MAALEHLTLEWYCGERNVLSRTQRIHQIAITEIARIICSVEPEMLHHFYDEHPSTDMSGLLLALLCE